MFHTNLRVLIKINHRIEKDHVANDDDQDQRSADQGLRKEDDLGLRSADQGLRKGNVQDRRKLEDIDLDQGSKGEGEVKVETDIIETMIDATMTNTSTKNPVGRTDADLYFTKFL